MEGRFQNVKEMIEDLRSENPDLRLHSIQGIHIIARTLGSARTREELLLYLTDYLDDNDEVLRVFAQALGTMLPEVGGIAYAQNLLQPLEMLCSLEEITVREEAVRSLQLLCQQIFSNPNAVEQREQYETLVYRLCQATPQCRSSACALMASLYSAPNISLETKQRVRDAFTELVGDSEIMVRRAACLALGDSFIKVLSASDATSVIPHLASFSTDEADGIRLCAVTSCCAVLPRVNVAHRGKILHFVLDLSSDKSWRVRYMMADSLGTLSNALSSSPYVEQYVVPIFRNLCKDEEGEIRASAVYNMASVLAACSDVSGKGEVLMTGAHLVSDAISHVRVSLANSLLRSVAHVPKSLWSSTILQTCITLLNDQEADVRLALISGFSSMGTTPEAKELAPQLVPVILELASDPQWRLRQVVLQQVPYLITSLEGNASAVLDVCVERMLDHAATIREVAVQACCKLVSEKGIQWSTEHMFPRMLEIVNNTNYLFRVALCHWFAALACVAAVDEAACMKLLWPAILKLQLDPVPNVKLNVAKSIGALRRAGKIPIKDAEVVLNHFLQDTSADVREAAEKALQ